MASRSPESILFAHRVEENERLRKENAKLRRLLAAHGICVPPVSYTHLPVPFHVLINPEVELLSPPDVSFFEGCLSLPGFVAIVPRARTVRVRALNEAGEPIQIEAEGWYARILQHEIDHLKGTLYIDRMWSRSFSSLDNYNGHWKSKSTAELLQVFCTLSDQG